VSGIKRPLDAAHRRKKLLPEELRVELAAESLPVFAPEDAAILEGERGHGFGDGPKLRFPAARPRIDQVECGPHVQASGVDVAEHAVLQPAAVEQRAELAYEVAQPLRWDDTVLHERNR